MESNGIEIKTGGLVCDNPKCDYTKPDVPIQDYAAWVGALCPDCGEPLLTEEQYQSFSAVMGLVNDVQELMESVGQDQLLEMFDIKPEDLEREQQQARIKIKVNKDAGIEVGELKFLDH